LVLVPATTGSGWLLDDVKLMDEMTLRSALAAAFAP
jgi:hypothetical protein